MKKKNLFSNYQKINQLIIDTQNSITKIIHPAKVLLIKNKDQRKVKFKLIFNTIIIEYKEIK